MARRRSRLRNVSEYLLARAVLGVVAWMPARTLAPTSRLLGRILYRVLPGRRRVIAENLEIAYGDAEDRPDADTVGRAAFAHLCLNFMELRRFPWDPERAKARINILDQSTLERLLALQQECGLVMAGAHFGAYEVIALVAPLFGFDCTSVARPLDNPYLDRWLNKARGRFGQRMVTNRGGMRDVMNTVNARGTGGLLVDLNHRRKRRVWVDYFGVPAATAPTAAVLALRTGCALASMAARRGKVPLTYSLEIGAILLPNAGADRTVETRRLMQAVTDEIEARVRSDPGQWLWTQRRWKTRPEVGELT